MALDFFTLYIVILLNSFFMGLVWLGFVITHRDIPGARLWLAACICTMVGGLLLAGDGTAWGGLSVLPAISSSHWASA